MLPPPYSPKSPFDLMTLWQGMIIGIGFLAFAFATALCPLGDLILFAMSLYDMVEPQGIFLPPLMYL